MQVFEAVARHLSFTKAAEELYLTQPAVSIQVRQLSELLDMALFEQMGKKVYLTEAGHTLLKHSRTMLNQLNEIEYDLNLLRGVEGGQLKICIASTVNYFAARLLARFCEKHKGIKISLEVINRQELLKRLEDNQPDLVLMGAPPDGMDVKAISFMDNPLIVIASPNHHMTGRKNIPISELNKETFLIRESGSGTRQAMRQVFDENGVRPTLGIQVSGNEIIKQSVQAGLGLAVVSIHTVRLELDLNLLTSLDIEGFPVIRQWFIVYRKGKQLTKTANVFIDFVLTETNQVGKSLLHK
ncbi:MAG: LysR family transcriptional regulator [Gammaproteobacteria bacterium]|nr:LysR family transcriptional regulator [Gammaproteobacteria bacterium]